ncbi:uncharacterized protein FFB14_09342 [Fusarium fujikuroi]|nr:uncharacterized protein FFB14_09342 [Fusarium fujikuroi]
MDSEPLVSGCESRSCIEDNEPNEQATLRYIAPIKNKLSSVFFTEAFSKTRALNLVLSNHVVTVELLIATSAYSHDAVFSDRMSVPSRYLRIDLQVSMDLFDNSALSDTIDLKGMVFDSKVRPIRDRKTGQSPLTTACTSALSVASSSKLSRSPSAKLRAIRLENYGARRIKDDKPLAGV